MTRHRRYLEARAAVRNNGGAVFMPGEGAGPDEFRPWMPGLGSLAPEDVARLHEQGAGGFTPTPLAAMPNSSEADRAPDAAGDDDAETERVLQQARKQADAILVEARHAAEQVQAEAQQRVEQTVAERARQVAAQVRREQEQGFQTAVEELLQSFQQAADEALQELSGQVAELAAAVTEKVIRRKVEADDAIVVEAIADAMRRLSDLRRLRVVVNPEDEATVSAQREALLQQAAGLEELQIVGSDGVERGGCLLESDGGEVDARISSQLQVIWEQVLGSDAMRKTA